MLRYFSEHLQGLQDSASQSKWSFRRDAVRLFQDYGMPRRKQDPWKYVDNSALLNLETKPVKANCKTEAADAIIFCNDQLVDAKLKPIAEQSLPQAWSIRSLSFEKDLEHDTARWGLDAESLETEHNSYSLLNAFSFEQAYFLEAQANIYLYFCAQDSSYLCPRLYVHVPDGQEVNIFLDTRDLGSGVYWNPYFKFQLGRGARVQIVQRGPAIGGNGPHICSVTLRGELAAEAHLDNVLFYWGMDLAIHDARFALCGEQAELSMRGICFAEGKSAYHLRSEQQHLCGNSHSESLYKNVLFDQAVTEFYGIIHAARHAVGTDAAQKNQNLLLSEQARAISRPQLEILNDDLQCSHGSATGSIDAEELFYMRSRGLDQSVAMRMAVVGFVEEICTYFSAELLDVLNVEQCLQALLSKRNH